jgi:hypothetical protein
VGVVDRCDSFVGTSTGILRISVISNCLDAVDSVERVDELLESRLAQH